MEKIGTLLKTKGVINDKQLRVALIQQEITGDLLGDTLIKLGFVSSKELGQMLAEQSDMEFVDLGEYGIEEEALRIIPKEVAEKTEFIPLEIKDGQLSIGVTNPGNISAVDTVTRITKNQPRVYMIDRDSFRDTLEKAYFFMENPTHRDIGHAVAGIKAAGIAAGSVVTKLTDLVIIDGIRRNATDIHINPAADIVHIFYRIDGVLQHGHGIPKAALSGIVSRIKVLSELNITEQRLPQDGSFTFSFLNKKYDIRVSTVPTIYGENVVMRVLAGVGPLLRVEKLGFDKTNAISIKKLFLKPNGIILITGPTGSGKTTTLYAALREVDLLEKNVFTVEDPVEYKLSLVKQTQVNEKVGYDFALAGRNFMRQDPNVMLIGEIRDEETAKIAIRAALTGQLVLSTLHANDAVTAIPRLIELKVDRFLMSSSLIAIIAQRLVRKICAHCKIKYSLDDHEISIFKEYDMPLTEAFKGKGCARCNGTGYSGRTVIGEVLILDSEIKELIYSEASVTAIQAAALKKGMRPLKEDAVKKAASGITTLDEVSRVTG
ncbi:MAG: type II/IV secretion system protein [Nitrospirae bacterium]|nr:MAG: type II/IV secretion system protein [Nitrospirota bacterium]